MFLKVLVTFDISPRSLWEFWFFLIFLSNMNFIHSIDMNGISLVVLIHIFLILVVLDTFHGIICQLYTFSGEMSVQIFYRFLLGGTFLIESFSFCWRTVLINPYLNIWYIHYYWSLAAPKAPQLTVGEYRYVLLYILTIHTYTCTFIHCWTH